MALPNDSAERKTYPMGTGVLDYFPDALAEVAKVSFVGNIQHNPGQPLHWAKEKSRDEPDCIIRHYTQRFEKDTDGTYHAAKMCWRALAFLQKLIEANHLKMTYNQYNEYLKKSPSRQIPCGEDVQNAITNTTKLAGQEFQQSAVLIPKGAYRYIPVESPDAIGLTLAAEPIPQTPSEASQLSKKQNKPTNR